MNEVSPFEQLLAAAAAQAQPQVLLFVFAGAALPADATPAQQARFAAGRGGELTPLMCVEKTLDELSTFDSLVQESKAVGPPWQVVFIAALGGREGKAPEPKAIDTALKTMVESVKSGTVGSLLALSAAGEMLSFV